MRDDPSLGERIRRARTARRLTQEQLAEKAEVSVDLVRKLEQGVRHTASMSSLTRIARAVDKDVPQLLGQTATIAPRVDEEAVGILAIRDELTSLSDFPGLADEEVFNDEPPSVDGLRLALAHAESIRQHGSFAQLGVMLPGLMAVFAGLVREVASEEAPRLFALVEDHGEAAEVGRVHVVWLS